MAQEEGSTVVDPPGTPSETRTLIVQWLQGQGWVAADKVATELRSWGLGYGQGATDLLKLVKDGRIEKRKSQTVRNRYGSLSHEYRAPEVAP